MQISDTLVGAVIALGGVLLALISGHLGDWIKSARERKESQRQRELSLNRDLYLPVIHAFTEGKNILIAIPETHHSKLAELKLSQAAQNALDATNLISTDGVMSALTTASRQQAEGMMRLMVLKNREVTLARDLDTLDTRANELNAEQRLIIDRARVLQDAGTLSKELDADLNAHFQGNRLKLQNLVLERQEKNNNRNVLLRELLGEVGKELRDLIEVSSDAIIAIRRDLGIPTNAEVIKSHYAGQLQLLDKIYSGYLDEILPQPTNTTDG